MFSSGLFVRNFSVRLSTKTKKMEEAKFNEDLSTASAPDHRTPPSRMLMLERRRRQFTLQNGIPVSREDQEDLMERRNFFSSSAVVAVGVSAGILIGNLASAALNRMSGTIERGFKVHRVSVGVYLFNAI